MKQYAVITAKYCNIFAPANISGLKEPKYIIGFETGDVAGWNGMPFLHHTRKPKILVGKMTISQSAQYLHEKFGNLHWTGYTPDEILRGTTMGITYERFSYSHGEALALHCVTLFESDIWNALQKVHAD